ncbi:MAG: thermonuclease family protein [Gammaproteobacteria bacterium]
MGRLFCFSLLFLLALPGAAARAQGAACPASAYDARVRIDYVIDGDTVILHSGEHLRLIGLDTPEINHEGGPSEPGALVARRYLVHLLAGAGPYPVIYGRERHDHYGRRLGHLFLPDGVNVQALLLRHGYATPLTIPPNMRFLDCYRAAAGAARTARRGIWRLPRYRPVDASALDAGTRGYHIVRGRVTRIGESRSSLWINLGRGFAVRILRSDLQWFDGIPLHHLKGREVEAQGLVYRRHGELRMRVRIGADLDVLGNSE